MDANQCICIRVVKYFNAFMVVESVKLRPHR